MFQMKNVITYQAANLPDAAALNSALESDPFKSPGSQELSRSGWTAPASFIEGMVADCYGIMLIALKQEERMLPPAVVRDQLQAKVERIEAEQNRKVYRKEKLQLKDEVIFDLLPQAFLKSRITYALICPEQGLIHIDASSHSRSEDLLNHLRKAMGTLNVRLPKTAISPDKVMTSWLQGEAMPQGWAFEDECELRDPMTEGSKITAKGQDLLCDEIGAHIENGMLVKRLSIEWQQMLRFVLHEDLSIHRLRLSDEYREQLDAETPEDERAALETEVVRYGLELARLTKELIDAFGGHADPDAYQLEQEKDGVAA
jgi:recombination associated protein RdgC